ncbi:hypothetical protein [Streptomyces sp. NBC_01092]|uniref:hypothetical protein n=1 Tax=Streptomyces sp. NBC_01092 TaxID=2903748 RepID=UPI00386FDFFC|nr:hypothetical protein OG254_39250 [Streptomyces sp. NBC_01092]
MKTSRILKRSALAVAGTAGVLAVAVTIIPQEETPAAQSVTSSPLLAAALMQAASLPFPCQEAIFKTGDQFATTRYAVPVEFWNAAVAALGSLTETERAELTGPACAAWNSWATANSSAVTGELDNRYRNAAPPVCNKFTVATVGTVRKFSPNTPAATRDLEKVVKKVLTEAMTKLSATASDTTCRTSYSTAKTAW